MDHTSAQKWSHLLIILIVHQILQLVDLTNQKIIPLRLKARTGKVPATPTSSPVANAFWETKPTAQTQKPL